MLVLKFKQEFMHETWKFKFRVDHAQTQYEAKAQTYNAEHINDRLFQYFVFGQKFKQDE